MITKITLIIASFWPSLILFITKYYLTNKQLDILPTLFILLIFLSASLIYIKLKILKNDLNVKTLDIFKSENSSENIVSYLFTIIMPLLPYNTTKLEEATIVLVTLSIIGIIFYHNDIYHMNLIFLLFGLHIYRVTNSLNKNKTKFETILLISEKRNTELPSNLRCKRLTDGLYLEDLNE